MKIAILDLGSNSFHLVVYHVTTAGWQVVDRKVIVNALGQYITADGCVPDAVVVESAGCVAELAAHARRVGARKFFAYGTRIFRAIKNCESIIDEVFKKSDLVIDVISPKKEAAIIHAAAKDAYGLQAASLILDIGGGSSECIVSVKGRMRWYESVECGTAMLRATFSDKQIKTAQDEDKMIRSLYGPVVRRLKKEKIETVYGTSGFLRYIVRWLGHEALLSDSVSLSRAIVEQIYKSVRRSNFGQGTEQERSLVYVGTAIIRFIMDELSVASVTVSEASSREGYLLSVLD